MASNTVATKQAIFNNVVGQLNIGDDTLLATYGYSVRQDITGQTALFDNGFLQQRPLPNSDGQSSVVTPDRLTTIAARLPRPLMRAAAYAASDKLLVCGFGRTINNVFVNELYSLDINGVLNKTPALSTTTYLTQPSAWGVDVGHYGILGGGLIQVIAADTYILSSKPVTNATLFGKYASMDVQLPDGSILMPGGYGDSKDSLNTVHSLSIRNWTTVQQGTLLTARADGISVYVKANEQVLFFGGRRVYGFGSNVEILKSAESYDPSDGQSVALDVNVPDDLGRFGQTYQLISDDLLMIFGGGLDDNTSTDAIYLLDLKSRKFTKSAVSLPTGLAYMSSAIMDGSVFLFGGVRLETGAVSNAIYRFTPSNTTPITLT